MKPKVFFFHYNKPASLAAGRPKLSVHFDGKCHIVDHLNCVVPIWSHHQKRQPRCIMKGKCISVSIREIDGGILKAYIN